MIPIVRSPGLLVSSLAVLGLLASYGGAGCSSGSSPSPATGDGGQTTVDAAHKADAHHKADAPAQIDTGVDAPHLMGGYTVVTIVTGQCFPDSVAVDGTNVYWSTLGSVAQAGKNGGGTPITLATEQQFSGAKPSDAIAVDATSVYWIGAGYVEHEQSLVKAPIGGGQVTVLASGGFGPDIAVDSTSVYFSGGLGENSTGDALLKVPTGGGTVTTLAPLGGTNGLAVNSSIVAVVTQLGVVRVPIGGGTPSTLNGTDEVTIAGMAMDETNMYWGSQGGGLVKMPIGATTDSYGTTLTSQGDEAWSVAVSKTTVFWTGGGAPLAVPIAGGTVTTLVPAADVSSISTGIATDGTSVYWSQHGDCGGSLATGAIVKATPK